MATKKESKLQVKIKKLDENAVIPIYAKPGDAGMDLKITSIFKKSLFRIEYGFGISLELPKNHYADLRPRSSIFKTRMILSNSPGTGDECYRGEYKAIFWKLPFISKPYKIGDRAVQIIITPRPEVEFIEVGELSETERGEGGFGSTGK